MRGTAWQPSSSSFAPTLCAISAARFASSTEPSTFETWASATSLCSGRIIARHRVEIDATVGGQRHDVDLRRRRQLPGHDVASDARASTAGCGRRASRLSPPQLCATRLIPSVAPRTKTISSGAGGADEAGDPRRGASKAKRHLGRALIDAAMHGRIGLGIAARDRVDHRPAASARWRRCRDRPSPPGSPGNRRASRAGGWRCGVHQANHAFRIGVEGLAHLLLADPVERVGDEGAGEQRLGLVGRRRRGFRGRRARSRSSSPTVAPCAHLTSSAKISSSGLALIVARAGEQQALQGLLAVGLLRVARDLDPGGDRAGRLVVGDRAPDLAARAARDARGGGRDWRHAAGGRARAARRRPRQRRPRRRGSISPSRRLSRPPAASVAATRLAPSPSTARSVRLTKPACPSRRRLSISRAPLPRRDAGEPVGPAVADEGLDDRGLGVVVEHDLGGEMIGGAGRDVDDLDQARRAHDRGRAGASSPTCRRGGRAGGRSRRRRRRSRSPPRRLRLSSSRPSTNSSRGPSCAQSSHGSASGSSPGRPRLGQRRQRRKVAPAPGFRPVRGKVERHQRPFPGPRSRASQRRSS